MIPLTALRKIYISLKEHKAVEKDVLHVFEKVLAPKYIKPKGKPISTLAYGQRNFFSILFLAIYQALAIPPERRRFYGAINHCLRGLVTGTDNLLDDEYKELLPLNFPDKAIRFKSVMHILLFDRILSHIVENGIEQRLFSRRDAMRVHQNLFSALVPIGAEEAQEEGGIDKIATPAKILSSVHMYKGGNLLCLSFVAPLLLEKEKAQQLAGADRGIFAIGVALQIIDDMTDFYEDIRHKNHNYLVSSIFHEGTDQEKASLNDALSGGGTDETPVAVLYPDSVTRVMHRAIGEALKGFELLATAGFWLDRQGAMNVIRYLFKLRGVENLLPFLPKNLDCLVPLRG